MILILKAKCSLNSINTDFFVCFFKYALPKEHLCEIMAMSGSIHLINVESLFITLNDSTRLRNTKKSASWDSTLCCFLLLKQHKEKEEHAQRGDLI